MKGINFDTNNKFCLCLMLISVIAVTIIPAYAAQIVKPTSGGTIDVGFATDPANPTPGGQTNFDISFINKSTHAVQEHIDYKIAVMEGSNQICGTSILHTAEGSITFPCQLPDAAKYLVKIEVDGILFQPIPPETATFTVDLTGGTGGANPSNTNPSNNNTSPSNNTQVSVIPSWVKTTAGWWSKGQVGDQDFVKGIQYMIQKGIMQIPSQTSSNAASTAKAIPSWVKTTAGWWSSGQVGDQDFVKGIQWLISNGIISV
ncbi:MAG: hypothetical protein KGI33_05575 [Thaumarchaeota archaeon]|nr:hypothetical protein [Nitrososphaerota archaeon]